MDKLKILNIYIKIVDTGSFAAAANELGLSPSTVSKAISRLEDDLGVRLLNRNTRYQRLTATGHEYAEVVRRLLTELRECESELKGKNKVPSGMLRVNLPVSYGRLYIVPLMKKFRECYPEINVCLTFSDEYTNLINDGYDLAIRTGRLEDCGFIGRQLSPIDFITCASKEYIDKQGVPQSLEDFNDHTWIRFRYKQSRKIMSVIYNDEFVRTCQPKNNFIVDDGEAMLELCRSGEGIIQAPHFIVRKDILSGKLIPILPAHRIREQAVSAIIAASDRELIPRKVRVFIEFLQDELAAIGEYHDATWASDIVPLQTPALADTDSESEISAI